MLLSFIVPAYNEELELPATLAALHSAGTGAGVRYEIIVVDDSSTDTTAAIAAEAGARVLSVRRRQIAAARNAGARAARGNVLFFVDADTRINSAHISGALAALARGCVGGSARVRMDGELPIWARVFVAGFCAVYFAANLGVGAFIFVRRDAFEAEGGFDEQYFAAEETYLSMALKRHGPFQILHEPVTTSARKIRMHSPTRVIAQMLFIIFGGKKSLRTREKLDLWYDGKREGRTA